jgi:hypothetical protein
MGFQTLIIGVAFLLFAIIFIVPVLTNIDNIAEDGLLCGAIGICLPEIIPTEETERFKEEVRKQQTEADLRLPDPYGKQLCNLTVEVEALYDVPFGSAPVLLTGSPFVKINTSDPANYQWDCQFPQTNSWIDKLSLVSLVLLDFIAFESEFIHAEIVLIDKDNPSKKYDAQGCDLPCDARTDNGHFPEPSSMWRDIRLTQTSGIIKTPYSLDQSFVIENIVYDDYILEIYYGNKINNLNIGEPVIDKVCTVGNNC